MQEIFSNIKKFCSRSIFFYSLFLLILFLSVDSDIVIKKQLLYKMGLSDTDGKNGVILYYDLAKKAIKSNPMDQEFQFHFVKVYSWIMRFQ